MQRRIRAGVAGLVVLALTPAAASADVTVRAEAFDRTVLPATSVPVDGPNALANGKSCPGGDTGRTAAGALERATNGDWDGSSFSFGLTVERIRDANLGGFPSPTFWNFVVDDASQMVGICDVKPSDGQEILFYEACADDQVNCFTGGVLRLTAPAVVATGKPFTVRVEKVDDAQSPPAPSPAAGATLTIGDGTATTGADGTARFTFDRPGKVTVVATQDRLVRDAATITVRDYAVPGARDRKAPVVTIKAPRDGRRYARGPRKLVVRVKEAKGLARVQGTLVRRARGRCTAFDAAKERFRPCRKRRRFDLGTAAKVAYLLPARLERGRYRFDVIAVDKAGNRGRDRAVFRVR
jgi:hypothetical protein